MPFLHEKIKPSYLSRKITLQKKYNKKRKRTLRASSVYVKQYKMSETHTTNSATHAERVCLYTSTPAHGSITLEAAISVPLFIFAFLTIMYIMNIIYIQTTVQMAIDEAARSISKTAYITTEFYENLKTDGNDADSDDENASDISSLLENIGAKAITIPYIKSLFLNEDIKSFLDRSYIVNGSDGISFDLSSVDMDENTIDIVASYTVTIPFIPDKLFSFKLRNHCFTRIYMGKDMDKEQTSAPIYVYYTVRGKVLHTDKYCRYLLNYSEALRYNDAIRAYLPEMCLLCGNHTTLETLQEENPIVFLTSSHEVFHLSLDCHSFTKNVFRQKRTSLDGEDICEQCLKGK